MSWVDCVVDDDYEIFSEHPYDIRKKSTGRVINETVRNDGYVYCYLNRRLYLKHRIVALQFIPNPYELPEIDHANHNRSDYHIENLRWISHQDNLRNLSSYRNVEQEYVDEISEEAIEITDYGRHRFEFYFYDMEDDAFYFYTGVNYRRLHVNIDARSGSAFVNARNTDNRQVKICLNKFKRLYDLL